jgi:hypothetical protein
VCSESVSVRVRSTSANADDSDPSTPDSKTAEEPQRCPYELWLALDLPDADDARYTLRLSWVASVRSFFVFVFVFPSPLDLVLEHLILTHSYAPPLSYILSRILFAVSFSDSTTERTHTQTPTDFALDVFDPLEAGAFFLPLAPAPGVGIVDGHVEHIEEKEGTRTRRKYARIRAVDAGVRTPGVVWVPSLAALLGMTRTLDASGSDTSGPQTQNNGEATQAQAEPVEFILTLEPLLLGVLPASLLPFLLVATAVLLALAAPGSVLARVQRGVEGLVREARRELEGEKGKKE